jgi:hypothetical protein
MSHAKGTQYEKLVHELVVAITRNTPLNKYVVNWGSANRISGASGYKHQIDLSLTDGDQLYLLELKCLDKSIGVSAMLLLASRLADIAGCHPSQKVTAMIVSRKRPSRNVKPLARHFGIQVGSIEDLQSYGLSFADQHFVVHVERVHADAHQDAEVIRGSRG